MSRTLFWYVFKDLVRIFALASVALAAIMSFGGLLRPLTEHGLDAAQVTRILGYFMPAMQTYSLPVAALFATTMVYGKLSADNELIACRAAGIGYWPIWLPALVLGLVVALVSLVFLCFIVPVFSLKVEKVIYSNLAELVQSQIEQEHRIELQGAESPVTIFAQQAFVLPPPKNEPQTQVVQLVGPMIVTYEHQTDKNPNILDRLPPPPEDFETASRATAYIRQNQDTDEVQMTAVLTDGTKFPRRFVQQANGKSPIQVSVAESAFTSDPFPSPVHENVKFMSIGDLKNILHHPDDSRKIQGLVTEFIRADQEQAYLTRVQDALMGPAGAFTFHTTEGKYYTLTRGDCPVSIQGVKLIIGPPLQPNLRPAGFREKSTSQLAIDATAQQIRVRCWKNVQASATENERAPGAAQFQVEADMIDAIVKNSDQATPHSSFARDFTVQMPKIVSAIAQQRNAAYYANQAQADPDEQMRLKKELIRLKNSAISEAHARVSFALSCLILVMVGCGLGMMFKSGNFLSAFALSVVPALISIVLVVTGQHVCENIPYILPKNFNDPLQMGLVLIWSGNAMVLVIAVGLLWRLSRQ
jgi:lipopolysaccharide export LptBFGC system permease protein LptF